jgi:integrase
MQPGTSQYIFVVAATGSVLGANFALSEPAPTVAEFVARNFETEVIPYLRPGGQKHYRYGLRKYVLPELGSLRLTEVTFSTVQGFVRKLIDAGFAVQTVRHMHQVINRVFKHALRTGHFHGPLPTVGVKFPYMARREKRALTIEQARRVISVLKRPYKEMAYLSITTSMNLAELCGLRWKRLNLTAHPVLCDGETLPAFSVAVRENFYEGSFGPPKTPNRKRVIPLTQDAVASLRRLKEGSRFVKPDDVVFATRNGTPKLASNLRYRVIKPAGKRAGVPWLNWHAFRNTHATLGEQIGMPLSDRQAQLGHGTSWMTQEYTVSDVERRRAGSEKLAGLLTCV